MDAEKFEQRRNIENEQSFGSVLKEVGTSVTELVRSEVDLVKVEIKESSRNFARHSAQIGLFGALMGISVMPFLAFLVIAFGRLFGGRYWLSSLLVAFVCALVGGMMAFRAYRKIQEEDFTLPRTRQSFEREKEAVNKTVEDLKEATKRRAA